MCIICQDWEKEKLTSKEAMRNISEMISSTKNHPLTDHLLDLANRIIDSEIPFQDTNPDLDKKWQEEQE